MSSFYYPSSWVNSVYQYMRGFKRLPKAICRAYFLWVKQKSCKITALLTPPKWRHKWQSECLIYREASTERNGYRNMIPFVQWDALNWPKLWTDRLASWVGRFSFKFDQESMSETNFRVAYQCWNAEIKLSDLTFEVMWLLLINQSALFQHRVATVL